MRTRVWPAIAIGLWVVTILAAALFFWRGVTSKSVDGRLAVALAPAERDQVLAEMRGMLASVQGVTAGLAAHDMKQVAGAASASGMSAAVDVSPALMAKLPLAFKELGMSMHHGWDELAASAQAGATPDQVAAKLNSQLQKCVACHTAYRLP